MAGYEDDINKYFFALNKGLERRIPWIHKIKKIRWHHNVNESDIVEIVKANSELFKHSGGSIENFIMKSKICHGVRVFALPVFEKFILSKEDMMEAVINLKKDIPIEGSKYMEMFS